MQLLNFCAGKFGQQPGVGLRCFLLFPGKRGQPYFEQRRILLDHPQETSCTVDSQVNGELVHPSRVAKREIARKFQAGFLYAL